MQKKIDFLVYEMLLKGALKPNLNVEWDSIRAKVFFIIFAPSYVNSLRQNRLRCCNLHDTIYIFLVNGVMTTPKRRILSFLFTVLCFKKYLLIHWFLPFYTVWSESICVPCVVWVSLVALFWCYIKLPREHGGRKLLVGLVQNCTPLGQIIITDHFL